MKLVSSPASPFVRKVRVLLRETGLDASVEELDVATTPYATAPEVIAANPVGKIPALIRPDGASLYDSRVITRYLDSLAGAGLYPEAAIWEVLTLEATGDAIMECAVSITYEGRLRPAEKQSDEWREAQWAKIARSLNALESVWLSHLQGPLNAGQISVACALAYLDFRHDARNWRAGRAVLADWFEGFAQRPSMQATAPIG